jgi:hypothetical protein
VARKNPGAFAQNLGFAGLMRAYNIFLGFRADARSTPGSILPPAPQAENVNIRFAKNFG